MTRASGGDRSGASTGVLASGLTVRGALTGRGDLTIEGTLEGDVTLEGAVVVGPGASVVGPVVGTDVEVHGEVVGPVSGHSVALRAGARVHGDVRALSLTIDDGASLDGLIEMGEGPGGGAR